MRRLVSTVFLGLAAFVASGSLLAEQTSILLSWNAPSTCPSGSDVKAEVRRLVGEKPMLSMLTVSGNVTFEAQVWSLELSTELDGQAGTRRFDGTSCQEVTNAAALTLALMLNPPPNSESENSAAEVPPPARVPRSRSAPGGATTDESRTPIPIRVGLTAAAGLSSGNLPALGPELELGVGATLGRWSVWFGGAIAAPQERSLGGSGSAGGELTLGALRALPCFATLGVELRLAVCLDLELNRLSGRGTGITDPLEGNIAWASVGAGAEVTLPLNRYFSLRTLVAGVAPLRRPHVFIEDIGELHRPAPLALRGNVGLRLSLW